MSCDRVAINNKHKVHIYIYIYIYIYISIWIIEYIHIYSYTIIYSCTGNLNLMLICIELSELKIIRIFMPENSNISFCIIIFGQSIPP